MIIFWKLLFYFQKGVKQGLICLFMFYLSVVPLDQCT